MLLVDSVSVSLPRTYQKVLNLVPTYDKTYAMFGIVEGQKQCVVHFEDGKLLSERIFEESIQSFAVLTERQAVVLQTEKNLILAWDLETHKWIEIPFLFAFQEPNRSKLFVFPETKSICILESGPKNNSTFRLSYFLYPLNEKSEAYESSDKEGMWSHQYKIYKGNNNSMLCFMKDRQDAGFELRTYDLRNKEQKFNVYAHENDIGKSEGLSNVQIAITTVWQMRPYEFMLVCTSSRVAKGSVLPNNNYVWNVKSNQIREANFNLGSFQQCNVDQCYIGTTSMFRGFKFQKGLSIKSPVFYIDNKTEKIVAQETWECNHLHKYDFPGYDGNMICDNEYENGNVSQAIVSTKKVMDLKEITIHLLCETIANCDEDLLYQVISLIDYEVTQ